MKAGICTGSVRRGVALSARPASCASAGGSAEAQKKAYAEHGWCESPRSRHFPSPHHRACKATEPRGTPRLYSELDDELRTNCFASQPAKCFAASSSQSDYSAVRTPSRRPAPCRRARRRARSRCVQAGIPFRHSHMAAIAFSREPRLAPASAACSRHCLFSGGPEACSGSLIAHYPPCTIQSCPNTRF